MPKNSSIKMYLMPKNSSIKMHLLLPFHAKRAIFAIVSHFNIIFNGKRSTETTCCMEETSRP